MDICIWKSPLYTQKSPVYTKELCMHATEPYAHSERAVSQSKEPYAHSKEPYSHSKEPYLLSEKPTQNQTSPTHTQNSPVCPQQSPIYTPKRPICTAKWSLHGLKVGLCPKDHAFLSSTHTHTNERVVAQPPKWVCIGTEWRRPIGCLKLQVIFRKRATNYRALLQKMTYKDKASCGSSALCILKWSHLGMGWLRSAGSIKLWVSFAKEPYKRDNILQKRPII